MVHQRDNALGLAILTSLSINPTKPLILHYSVTANMLLSSVSGKVYLTVCSVTLIASPKLEAWALIEELLKEYNQVRPHSSLGYRPPAPEAVMVKILT